MKLLAFCCCLLFLIFSAWILPFSSQASTIPDIDVNEDGYVFVSGIQPGQIHLISPYGQLINRIQVPSSIQSVDHLSACPCGGYLLISDTANGRALTLNDRTGNQINLFSRIQSPGSVSVSSHSTRHMAIADLRKNSVHLFTESGSFIREIAGSTMFSEPSKIMMDRQNNLWVLDRSRGRLLRFDPRGVHTFTLQPGRNVPMRDPLDFSIDYGNRIHVLEQSGNVQVFNAQGRHEMTRNLQQVINARPLRFSINPSTQDYHVIASNGQYFHVRNNMSLGGSLQNLSTERVKKVIVLRIGSRIMEHVGFEMMLLEEAPFIDRATQRSMVPIRAIAEIFGADVSWNNATRQVTIRHQNQTIVLTINSLVAHIGNRQVQIDTQPVIRNSRTFVPIRFISEAFGANVDWIPDTQRIIIAH